MSDGIVGEMYESNNCGRFEIIKKAGRTVQGHQLYLIRFLKTGYATEAVKRSIKRGEVRDPFYPSIYGVGYTGNSTATEGGEIKKSYSRWYDMLRRCYKPDHPQYRDYGGRGIGVSERWHCFEHYEQDVLLLEGYGDVEKDTLDRIDNDGNYEPSNCRWASRETQNNNQRQRKDQKTFIAITPGPGDGFYFADNQTEFARAHDITQQGISKCLRGGLKTHKGWRFEYLEEYLG